MATSQNGWTVLGGDTTGKPPRLRIWKIPGVDRRLKVRDGSAGFLLVHLAMWFDAAVEPLDQGQLDDWGWAARPVRGSTTISNHASGTAIDLNATKHPMGVPIRDTFTPAQIAKIRRRMTFFRSTLRWGGDYQNRPDGMHFEIDAGLSAVEKQAKRLMDSPRGKAILKANPDARSVILS